MTALVESQERTKQLLWKTYKHLGVEEVKWCWSWMLGECGKWEEETMWQVLNRYIRDHPPDRLPTLTDLVKEAFKRNREIIANTPAEPVNRTNPHMAKETT